MITEGRLDQVAAIDDKPVYRIVANCPHCKIQLRVAALSYGKCKKVLCRCHDCSTECQIEIEAEKDKK